MRDRFKRWSIVGNFFREKTRYFCDGVAQVQKDIEIHSRRMAKNAEASPAFFPREKFFANTTCWGRVISPFGLIDRMCSKWAVRCAVTTQNIFRRKEYSKKFNLKRDGVLTSRTNYRKYRAA
jgi:hypothetical protein